MVTALVHTSAYMISDPKIHQVAMQKTDNDKIYQRHKKQQKALRKKKCYLNQLRLNKPETDINFLLITEP